jgi:hypothetical protein
MVKNRLIVLRTILVVVIALVAPNALAEHSWATYHWARTTSSFTLQTVDSCTPDWDFELGKAVSEWSQSNSLDLSVTSSDDSARTRKRCPMVGGQIRVCNAAYGQNGWLGLASIGIDSNGHIDQGAAKMNDSYDWYFTPNEKRHVMCQEVGHLFGLGHTSEDGSSQSTCMDYSTSPNSISPNNHDYQQLSAIYSHTDSYNTYDDGGSSGGGTCHAPPGKGCNKFGAPSDAPMGVRVKKGDGHELWVAPRAGGGLWIHHVTLVPEDAKRGH